MRIMIIAEYLDDISNPSVYNSRFLTIADELVAHGHEIQIVTTDFVHSLKKHIEGVTNYKGCEVITLHEPGYKRNISLKRFYSHYVLSKKLNKWLSGAIKPDVVYCAVPSLDFAYEAAKYAKKNNIKFVVDIQDLWPEAFEMVVKIPMIGHLLFTPFRVRANYIYRSADRILAVSKTYMDRALKVNTRGTTCDVVYLGTSLERFDSFVNEPFPIEKQDGEIWLAYVGTLGHSYDLKTVFDALKLIESNHRHPNLKFIIMGDGPLRTEFEDYAITNGLPIYFTGKLPYPNMVAGLKKSDIVINPIKRKSAASIINKHGDYAASGKPVINTQESIEYRNIVEKYNMGINCACENATDVAKAIKTLVMSRELREAMGNNARQCAEERFDRFHCYSRIIAIIESEFDNLSS